MTPHVDLFASTEIVLLDAWSDFFAVATTPLPTPNNPELVGLTYSARMLWQWPLDYSLPPHNLSATNGLTITILP